jgi:hypothetical protein
LGAAFSDFSAQLCESDKRIFSTVQKGGPGRDWWELLSVLTNARLTFITADFSQLEVEAQNRWLRPAEICEILSNYKLFSISPEPPHRPASMAPLILCELLNSLADCAIHGSRRNSLPLILLNCHVTEIGGSLFLFDRKILRYFRKDGHNWRKKKDGKTVKEAHEKLKVSKAVFSLYRKSLFWKIA